MDTISNVEDTISSVGDSVSTVKDITDIVKQDTFIIEQQELNSSFTNVDSDKDSMFNSLFNFFRTRIDLVSKDSNLTCPNSSGFCSESVTVIDPSDIHYVTTIELPEEGTKEVTILGRCSVLYSPCSSNE